MAKSLAHKVRQIALDALPTHHGIARPFAPRSERVVFTDSELDLIHELLGIAQGELTATIAAVDKVSLNTPFAERLRVWLEQSADIRERIEAR